MRKKVWKKAAACLLSVSMVLTSGTGLELAKAANAEETTVDVTKGSIVLDGNDIKADSVNGLTYKGFGLLSANSTSDLLMDYKSQQPEKYAQLMQYLFGGKYPIFTHVKLEMGNDRNNSTGSESATKRSAGEDANVLRNPGWQLAADAKKINPNLKVSVLSWNSPKWVENDKTNTYKYIWYKQTILAAYEQYGFMVDYINPNTNEYWGGDSDISFTKQFAKWIASESSKTIADETALKLYKKIKLIVSDEANVVSDEVAEAIKSDAEFAKAVDVVGYHYKTADDENGGMKYLAEVLDKEVWNSEEQATFCNSAFRPVHNDTRAEGAGIGGPGSALEMGNTVIKSFVDSRRSHVIYQPAIGSFYEGAQYSAKELVSARDPWSGWMHYDAGLLILAHISKFAVTGWENEDNTADIWRAVAEASKASALQTGNSNAVNGRNGGENYMTLAAPTKDNFSTVIVNDSKNTMTYTLETKNMNFPEDQKLELWETRAADDGAFNENYMKCLGDVSKNENGVYTFTVQPYSTVTVTSLDVSDSEEHTQGLPVEGERTVLDTDATGDVQNTEDGYLYADDFEYTDKKVAVLDGKGGLTGETEDYIASRGGDKGAMARYTHTVNGAFEVYKTGTGNRVLRQQLDTDAIGVPGAWNNGTPMTVIGDYRWTNYTAAIDCMFEHKASAKSQFVTLGIRQTGGYHTVTGSSGYTLKVAADGTWQLMEPKKKDRTSDKGIELASGTVDASVVEPGTWFQVKVSGAGNTIKAYINDELVATCEATDPTLSGRIAIGCGNTYTRFDNLAVTKIKGYAPYYTEYMDNMETYDLTAEKNEKLQYNDQWTHTCANQSMYVYQRTMSYSKGKGASLTYRFKGTGMDILGYNTADSNQVKVTVDGTVTKEADSLYNSSNMCTAYRVDGLEYGEHTVTIEVVSGSLYVDGVAVLGDLYQGEEVKVAPKVGTETNLPEESLSTEVPTGVVPGLDQEEPATPTKRPTVTPTVKPSTAPTDAPKTSKASALKKGTVVNTTAGKFKVTDVTKKTVAFAAPVKKTVKKVVIPATIKVNNGGKVTTYKVTEIKAKALSGCKKLTAVTIGKNVKTIGKNAFANAKKLKKITIKSTNLKKVGKNAIKGIRKKAVISCGKKKVKAYKKLFKANTGYKKTMKIVK